MTNTEKLTAYAEKMFRRGDSFRDIMNYLDRQGADNQLKNEIIVEIEELAKAGKTAREQAGRPRTDSKMMSIWGIIIIIGGLLFVLALCLPNSNILIFLALDAVLALAGCLITVNKIRGNRLNDNKNRLLKRR